MFCDIMMQIKHARHTIMCGGVSLAVLLVSVVTVAIARKPDSLQRSGSFGLIAGGQYFRHSGAFPVSDIDTCGIYMPARPLASYLVGLTYDMPMLSFADISARLLYQRMIGSFTAQSCCTEVFDARNQQYVPFTREFEYRPDIRSLVVDVGVQLFPIPSLPFYVRMAGNVTLPIFGATVTQRERIVSPDFVRFDNNSTERITAIGELSGLEAVWGANAGLGVHIPLSSSVDVYPEISYQRHFTTIDPIRNWQTESVRLLFGIRYHDRDSVIKQEEPRVLPVKQEIPTTATIVHRPVLSLQAQPPLVLRQTVVTQTYPLLPYIFFDSASTILRSVYRTQSYAPTFTEKELSKETLDIYYSLLPIIAQRLLRNPAAVLTIIGTSDSKEAPTEAERLMLARQRADVVTAMLSSIGNIPRQRIVTTVQAMPTVASSERIPEGVEENRRVEIVASHPDILAPVVHSRFWEYVFDEKSSMVSMQSNDTSAAWTLSVMYRQTLLKAWSGKGQLPSSYKIALDSLPFKKISSLIAKDDSLTIAVRMQTQSGGILEQTVRQPFHVIADNIEISRLSLIVFDFDKADISSANKTMMQSFVREALQPTSESVITGTTDRVGEEQYNMQLSQARADAVKKYLLALQPQATILSCKGLGESSLLFSNEVPEGRFYCRTVSIIVKTPIRP